MNKVELIVVQTTGDITVISKSGDSSNNDEKLKNVAGFPRES